MTTQYVIPTKFIETMKARQKEYKVSNKELRGVVGWSESTQRRRERSPENITLAEAWTINNYLRF